MRGTRLTLIGCLIGLVGLVLLVAEAGPVVGGKHVLSSTSQLVMWAGLAVMAVGGVLLVFGVWATADEMTSDPDGGE